MTEPSGKISVLLVDDRPEKLLSLEAVLADLPLDLVRATSGREALRWLLRRDFALILLDIDMPGLDGFETASLIRQRKNTRDTPIIFVTAYQDDVLMARSYSLGAVDYILQPVVPEVLKSKVSVFVELYRKAEMIRQQALWQENRALQLQKLAASSVAINAAQSMEETLRRIIEGARDVIGSHQAVLLFLPEEAGKPEVFPCFSDERAEWRGRRFDFEKCLSTAVGRSRVPTRMTEVEVRHHQDWEVLNSLELPPIRGMLAAPLIGRTGQQMGLIYLCEKRDGDFSQDDEAILVQFAQMAVVAMENILNAEARQANRAKDQFIAVLSHELRTPLTPALAMLGTMLNDGRLPEDVRDDLATVHRNVELEARLIDDLLDLTRVMRGKLELHLSPLDVHGVLRRALAICQHDILGKDLQVNIRLNAEHRFVLGDETRLQQVFWNLIKNSVKFTAPNGRIQITSTNDRPGHIQIAIEDTGIGIDPEVLPKIFTAFEQGKAMITRQFGGLGLGLAISKAILDYHKGSLAASSEGHGLGSRFAMELPLTDQRPVDQTEIRESVGAALPRSVRVLLVEDHRDTARVMARILRDAGLKVEWAPTVAEALHMASESHFEVLISDIGLPDGSGLDLMRQLKAKQAIVGIALSGFGMEDDIRRSREAGFNLHLTKPLNFKVLLERIQELCFRAAANSPANAL